jgi:hypothetical protein
MVTAYNKPKRTLELSAYILIINNPEAGWVSLFIKIRNEELL